MDKCYRFGPVVIGFRDFPVCAQWPFGDWKLDPYTTDCTQADIWVVYAPTKIVPNGVLLQQERSALSLREVWRLPDDRILWQQTQNDEKLLQFVWKDNRICLTCDTTDTWGMAALEALTFLEFPCMLLHNVLTFHSVLLEHKGKGILIAGASGVGKSTHARLWRDQENALIINGDRAACYRTDRGWIGFGTPWCGTSGEHSNRQVPISALVFLRQGNEDVPTPLSPAQALSEALATTVCPGWQEALPLKVLDLLDDFLRQTPVMTLTCTPTRNAVKVLKEYVTREG